MLAMQTVFEMPHDSVPQAEFMAIFKGLKYRVQEHVQRYELATAANMISNLPADAASLAGDSYCFTNYLPLQCKIVADVLALSLVFLPHVVGWRRDDQLGASGRD
jgi:hypothetical protein